VGLLDVASYLVEDLVGFGSCPVRLRASMIDRRFGVRPSFRDLPLRLGLSQLNLPPCRGPNLFDELLGFGARPTRFVLGSLDLYDGVDLYSFGLGPGQRRFGLGGLDPAGCIRPHLGDLGTRSSRFRLSGLDLLGGLDARLRQFGMGSFDVPGRVDLGPFRCRSRRRCFGLRLLDLVGGRDRDRVDRGA